MFFLDKTKVPDKTKDCLELSEDEKCNDHESLLIYGHPVREEAGKPETRKLRLSIGMIEKHSNPGQSHRLTYTNGASPGLSGAPVMAIYGTDRNRRYKVLAIHSGGTTRNEVINDKQMINYGQIINRAMLRTKKPQLFQ